MPNQLISYFFSVFRLSHRDILEVEPSNTVPGGAWEKQERMNVVLFGQCAIFPSFLFLWMVAVLLLLLLPLKAVVCVGHWVFVLRHIKYVYCISLLYYA